MTGREYHEAPTEPADVLDAAADYIERHGWLQGQSWLGEWPNLAYRSGPVCASGAIRVAVRPDGKWSNTAQSALQVLENYLDAYAAQWNDIPGRTRAEVVQALRDAAIKACGDEFRSGGAR